MKKRFVFARQMTGRIYWLLALLGLSAGLAWHGWEGEVSIPAVHADEPAQRNAVSAQAVAEVKPLRLDPTRLNRSKTLEEVNDLFDVPQWQEPPPLPAVVVSPPLPLPPKPPELPFSYIGQMTEKGETKVFLAAAMETHTARVGDTLRGVYRVERVSPSAVVFTFLPMNTQQTLSIAPQN